MNMKFFNLLLLLFFLMSFDVMSQGIEGTWIAIYEKTINTRTISVDEQTNESYAELLINATRDTTYFNNHMIFEFSKQGKVRIIGPGTEFQHKYSRSGNKLTIRKRNENVSGSFTENEIRLILTADANTIRELVLKKIPSVTREHHLDIDSNSLVNSNWVVSNGSSSEILYDLHFFENDEAIILTHKNGLIESNYGKYKSYNYKGNYFIFLYDESPSGVKVLHLNSQKQSKIAGSTYINSYAYKPPQNRGIEFYQDEVLEKAELDTIYKNLIGAWRATNNPFKVCADSCKMEDPVFEITFNADSTFNLHKSLKVKYPKREESYVADLNGKWELSLTGKYIVLKPVDFPAKVVAISSIESNFLEGSIKLRAFETSLDDYVSIKMTKP